MQILNIFMQISLLKFCSSYESDSAEGNRIEISPFYDTVIFSDVVDIINELNKNLKSPFHEFEHSESESDDNIEDLLSEYQVYLDKAHDQRRLYLEKYNKTKNKVPRLRRENFVKTNIPNYRYKNWYTHSLYNSNAVPKIPQTVYSGPIDLLIPFNQPHYYKTPEQFPSNMQEPIISINKIGLDKKSYNMASINSEFVNEQKKAACVCKSGQLTCKQCLVPTNTQEPNKNMFSQNSLNIDSKLTENILDDMTEKADTLNIRVKVDIQVPNTQDSKYIKHSKDSAPDNDEEYITNVRLPSTYFNFPIPMDMLGFKKAKANRHDFSPLHKVSLHKKKKFRFNNNNKKHRKKMVTYHNIKLTTQTLNPLKLEHFSESSLKNLTDFNGTSFDALESSTLLNVIPNNYTVNNTEIPDTIVANSTQFDENVYLMVNISNNNESETEDLRKTGNSIELEYKQTNTSTQPAPMFREKREASLNTSIIITNSTTVDNNEYQIHKTKKLINVINKNMISEAAFLYWPNNLLNNMTVVNLKKITDVILERETSKAKLNITKEAIRNNRTKALEQAIFGNVDWDDIDTIVPTFISFVGKYLNGMLTFCSDRLCHSIKCEEKTCVHRTCTPEQRFNLVGHCDGCNKTDSFASMESIMDLPSNVAFKIVDILQNKMLGKLYGKVTLCISSKCISFVTSKKTFIKTKCPAKNLNKTGHCTNKKKGDLQA